MKKQLLEKQQDVTPCFSNEEVYWLLEHIGHPDPSIRDSLIYSTIARGISSDLFTEEQYQLMAVVSMDKHLVGHQSNKRLPATLVRSFSALLNTLLVYADATSDSRYYQLLSTEQRQYFFDCSLTFLKQEQDFTNHSPEYGWVHAFAHGADFLAQTVAHPLFPKENISSAFDLLLQILKTLPHAFAAGEERRLAAPVYIALQQEKISSEELAHWLDQIDFPTDADTGNVLDYDHFRCFKNFLAAIYFQLESSDQMSNAVKTALMERLKNYF